MTSDTNAGEDNKYNFEPDSEEDEMENEIGTSLGKMRSEVEELNALSRAIRVTLPNQNETLNRITKEVDEAEDGISRNKKKLESVA